MILLSKRDPFTGKAHSMVLDISSAQLDEAYSKNGRCIQDIAPHLTPDEREFILTGIVSKTWDSIFAEDNK